VGGRVTTTFPVRRDRPTAVEALRVVALGDSITSGDGVGLVTPPALTWAALLAGWLAPADLTPLARAGARLRDVRAEQLPVAVAARPHVATLCVGLNDLVKTRCVAGTLQADVHALVGGLRSAGATVVVTRLHDPGSVLRLPSGLAAQVAARVRLVNGAIDVAAAGDPGVVVVDLGTLVADRACWAVDRVHPSWWGQRLLAAQAAGALGLVAPAPAEGARPRPPSSLAHWGWLVRSGAPWLVKRAPAVGPPVLAMLAGAARDRLPGPGAAARVARGALPGRACGRATGG